MSEYIPRNIVTKRTLYLELTEEQAAWLHSLMQNPINAYKDGSEDPEDACMRKVFFDATNLPL